MLYATHLSTVQMAATNAKHSKPTVAAHGQKLVRDTNNNPSPTQRDNRPRTRRPQWQH